MIKKSSDSVKKCPFKLEQTGFFDLRSNSLPIPKTTNSDLNNHFKSIQWSPEGLQLLSNSGDNAVRIFNYNEESDLDKTYNSVALDNAYTAEGSIYSTEWYPYKSIIAKYKTHDDKDELLSSISAIFSSDGYFERISTFDVQHPGYPSHSFKTSQTKKSQDGLKGIVSCLAVPPYQSPNTDKIISAATFSGNLSIWDHSSRTLVSSWKSNSTPMKSNGITSLQFSPDGTYLFAGARKTNKIHCWDIRNTTSPVSVIHRISNTLQRMGFTIDGAQNYLVSGNTDGSIWFNCLSPEALCFETFKFSAHK
ncbi:hypothetical protein BB560_003824, partial [Smittium megazygosporum]